MFLATTPAGLSAEGKIGDPLARETASCERASLCPCVDGRMRQLTNRVPPLASEDAAARSPLPVRVSGLVGVARQVPQVEERGAPAIALARLGEECRRSD